MNELMLFTDGSVNTKLKIGYGAYLAFSKHDFSFNSIKKKKVNVKRFEETSSTKLELQSLLWALSEISLSKSYVVIYTDSQNIISLLARRKRLEENNFSSKKNKFIRNYKLYQEFYKITDKIDCKFVKMQGHKNSILKDDTDWLFSLVDKVARNALRKEKSSTN